MLKLLLCLLFLGVVLGRTPNLKTKDVKLKWSPDISSNADKPEFLGFAIKVPEETKTRACTYSSPVSFFLGGVFHFPAKKVCRCHVDFIG